MSSAHLAPDVKTGLYVPVGPRAATAPRPFWTMACRQCGAIVPPEDAQITIELGNEFPISVSYDIAGGHGAVTIMQAPRVQS